MNLDLVFAHNPQCPVRPVGEGLVIMSPAGDTTHSLEDLGAFIWNQLDGSKSAHTVLQDVLAQYDVSEETATADLVQFLEQMKTAELIVEA